MSKRQSNALAYHVYAALRPKSNEKAALVDEYKSRAKQNRENRATTTGWRRRGRVTNALLIALLNGNS